MQRNTMQMQERERKNTEGKQVTETKLKHGVETENEGGRMLLFSKAKATLKYCKCIQKKRSMYVKLMNGMRP